MMDALQTSLLDLHKEARRIVQECFADENAIGMIRVREHQLFRPDIDVLAFLRDLHFLLEG